MLKKISQCVRVSVLLSCLALTTIAPVQKSNAVVSVATGFVPTMILGAVLYGSGFGLTAEGMQGSVPEYGLVFLGSVIAWTGVVILDEKSSTVTLKAISAEKVQEYDLTPHQYAAYNEAVLNGEMDAILQTAGEEFSKLKEQTVPAAGVIMRNLLDSIDPNARDAFYKIFTKVAIQANV